MGKYRVYLTAISSASVEIEADGPEEALKQAYAETDGYAEAEYSDWDYEYNEVEDLESGKYVMSNNKVLKPGEEY